MIRHALDWFALRGEGYAFWSGIGSGSPIIVAVGVFWRRHNCHEPWCWRIQWREHEDGAWLCRRHHPARHVAKHAAFR